jgi:hypothetical protein
LRLFYRENSTYRAGGALAPTAASTGRTHTMTNPPKPKFTLPIVVPVESPVVAPVETVPDRADVTAMIEALFDVLEHHQAGPNEGVLALMTSFIQGASRILELSAGEEAEHNRESLLAMLEQARFTIDTWSLHVPPSSLVH